MQGGEVAERVATMSRAAALSRTACGLLWVLTAATCNGGDGPAPDASPADVPPDATDAADVSDGDAATVDATADTAPTGPITLKRCTTPILDNCKPIHEGDEVADVLWLLVALSADLGAPSQIMLRVDGKVAGTKKKASWDFQWDSSFSDDGPHLLRVEVTLADGTQALDRNVVVNNCDADHDQHAAEFAGCDGDDCDDGDGPLHAHERAVGLRCAWPMP